MPSSTHQRLRVPPLPPPRSHPPRSHPPHHPHPLPPHPLPTPTPPRLNVQCHEFVQ